MIPRSVRLSEAPSYGQPIALYGPTRGARRPIATSRTNSCGVTVGPHPRPPASSCLPESGRRRHRCRRWSCDGPARRPTAALGRGLGIAHPAAARFRDGAVGDPARPHRPEPVPAAAAMRRGRARGTRGQHREHGVLQPILVTETARRLPAHRRRAAPPGGPAGRPRAIPAVVRQRPTSISSSSRWSRTSSAPTSTRWRRRVPSASSSTSSALTQERSPSGRPGPVDRREHAAPARSRPGRPGGSRRRTHQRGPRARHRRPRPSSQASARRERRRPRDLSVRQTEELVRRLREPRRRRQRPRDDAADPDLERVEDDLRRRWAPRSRSPARVVAGGS